MGTRREKQRTQNIRCINGHGDGVAPALNGVGAFL